MEPGNEAGGKGQRWEWSLEMRLGNAMLEWSLGTKLVAKGNAGGNEARGGG